MTARTLIVCIGNSLVADDGVGCRVYDRLNRDPLPPDVRLELLGTGGLALLELLEGEDQLIVVDAVQLGGEPGQVHVLEWDQIPKNQNAPVSLHGIGVAEAITVGRLLYPDIMPHKVTLIGIEGVCFDQFCLELSAPVAVAMEVAVRRIKERIM